MAKTIDRISGFLTRPETRLRYYNDQQIEVLLKKDINSFSEKTKFAGRVIGVPRVDENASFTPFSTTNQSYVEEMVLVRLDDIDEFFLPDPSGAGLDATAIIDIILSHPLAVVDPSSVQQNSLRLGERVLCEFNQNPGSHGRQRGLRVIKVLDSLDADEWRKSMAEKLTNNGLGELASAFLDGNLNTIGNSVNNDDVLDFYGNYDQASPKVKLFLDDLAKRIRQNNKAILLPIYVGSLYRSFGDQAAVMYGNVVEGKQENGVQWFIDTYDPKAFDITTITPDKYASNRKKIKKESQRRVLELLNQAIDGELNKKQTIESITNIYEVFYNTYGSYPSEHNFASAVDIRTADWRREQIGRPVYTDSQKTLLENFSKPKSSSNPSGSDYSTFANIESFGKTGEHLHVNVKLTSGEE